MNTPDDLLARYLADLQAATGDLPQEARDDLLTDVRAHLDQVAATGDEAAVREAIDRLGSPSEIAASARVAEGLPVVSGALSAPPTGPMPPASPTPPRRSSRMRDTWTVLILLLGPVLLAVSLGMVNRGLVLIGVIAGTAIGWGLLWTSETWMPLEKLLGTLVWPGGFVTPFVFMMLPTSVCTESTGPGGTEVSCTGFSLPLLIGIPVSIVVWLAPIAVGVFLLRQADRRRMTT